MSRDLFGHPRGLTYLFGTEMWERFTYYGMRALFIYYLTEEVLLPGHVEHVLFYPQMKTFYEWINRPLNVQQLSSLIYGTYTGLVYATPLLGGYIADRFIGQRHTVIIGILLMGAGQFMMTSEMLLFPSLFLMIVGSGFFKTNTSAQVGMLYPNGDARRDRAYSIYYVGTNLGAFLSPLVAGTLGEAYGWGYGFAVAGVGMVIALIIYLCGWRTLPAKHHTEIQKMERRPLTKAEWKSVAALILLVVPLTLWWACYEQQGNTIALWAMDNTDRTLIPGVINWLIDATWFQSINPLMIFSFTPVLVAPLKIASLMMAVNFVPNFLGGGFLQGWLGTYWTTMSKPTFFVMIAVVSAIAGLIVWAMERPLRPLLQEKP